MDEPDPIAPAASDIMSHVNEDHVHNLLEYLRAFGGVEDATDARMTGVDRDGFDIEAATPSGSRSVRILWGERLDRRGQVREAMVRLAQQARAKLAQRDA